MTLEEIQNLKVGDIIFGFSRNFDQSSEPVYMVDENGDKWKKLQDTLITYKLKKLKIVSISKPVISEESLENIPSEYHTFFKHNSKELENSKIDDLRVLGYQIDSEDSNELWDDLFGYELGDYFTNQNMAEMCLKKMNSR